MARDKNAVVDPKLRVAIDNLTIADASIIADHRVSQRERRLHHDWLKSSGSVEAIATIVELDGVVVTRNDRPPLCQPYRNVVRAVT
jgi:hypothetical protein